MSRRKPRQTAKTAPGRVSPANPPINANKEQSTPTDGHQEAQNGAGAVSHETTDTTGPASNDASQPPNETLSHSSNASQPQEPIRPADGGDAAAGDVPVMAGGDQGEEDLATRASAMVKKVSNRLMKEGRWFGEIELTRDKMMKDAKKRFPDKRARQIWVYGELDRMYPPLSQQKTDRLDGTLSHIPTKGSGIEKSDDGQIQGLSNLPAEWPELPANAPLAAEVGWVQANRLRIVTEKPGGATVVDLGQALSPAPSWSALGWLETSIRSYAKFVDVAAKATASGDDDGAVMRRERMAIEEMQALLDEMNEADAGGEA